MRRRTRRSANISESTGKIGQELPSNQPRPLVPLYPEESRAAEPRAPKPVPVPASGEARAPCPPAQPRRPAQQERPEWNEPAGSGRLEMETQPELPSVPPPEAEAVSRSPQAPKGFVVLAIGL